MEMVLLLASCDVTGAALGSCVTQCPRSTAASYTICAEKRASSLISKPIQPTPKPIVTSKPKPKPLVKPKPKPRRLCSYYVNGTIDVPTSSVITAWVDVGSRACIGDPKPVVSTPVPKTKTVSELTYEAFTAHATAPFAYLRPSSQAEVFEFVNFGVSRGGGEHAGELFGQPASIRFVAISIAWTFSDGQRMSGQFVSTSFSEPRIIRATARVNYRIDYRRPQGSWVLGAALASLDSNQLSLLVVDPPRRSLLVG